jgi:hypothetical protein
MSATIYVRCIPRYAPRRRAFNPPVTAPMGGPSPGELAELLSVSEWITIGWDWMPARLSFGARMRRRAAMNQGDHEHHGRMALTEDPAGNGGRWDKSEARC